MRSISSKMEEKIEVEFKLMNYLNQYRSQGIEFKFNNMTKHKIKPEEGFSKTAYIKVYQPNTDVEIDLIKRFVNRRWEERGELNTYEDFLKEEIELIKNLHSKLMEHELVDEYEWKYKPILKLLKEQLKTQFNEVSIDDVSQEAVDVHRSAFEVALIQYYCHKRIDQNIDSEFFYKKVARELQCSSASQRLYQTYLKVITKDFRLNVSFRNDKLNNSSNRKKLQEFNNVIDYLSQRSMDTLKAKGEREQFRRNANL